MNDFVTETEKKSKKNSVFEPEFKIEAERQIVIHCRCDSRGIRDEWIRIWKTTYLIDRISKYKSELLFAYNISFYPDRDLLPCNSSKKFTLVFSSLPKNCQVFDLIEVTDDNGEFISKGIIRTNEDIYYAVFK
ncbi:MAG: hypothetical protein WCP85_13835 [Mariniphaga sp.]